MECPNHHTYSLPHLNKVAVLANPCESNPLFSAKNHSYGDKPPFFPLYLYSFI